MKTTRTIATIALILAGHVSAETVPTAEFFPYVKGRYWLYDGTVKFARNQEAVEKKITGWKSEVLDSVEGENFKAALLKGSPRDLMWYGNDSARGVSIVILTGQGEFHDLGVDDDSMKTFAKIKSTGKLPPDLISDETLFFRIPMKNGDRFGDPEQVKLGPRYCWVVENTITEKPEPAVKGIMADKEFPTYVLRYPTNPDTTTVRFAAGLGIVRFDYVHHGTPGDCDVHLVETGDSPDKK